MKKIALICSLVLLMSGCANSSQTIAEYSAKMEKVRNSTSAYYVEATKTSVTPNETIQYKSYKKGEK